MKLIFILKELKGLFPYLDTLLTLMFHEYRSSFQGKKHLILI